MLNRGGPAFSFCTCIRGNILRSNRVYIGADGDDMGSRVAAYILASDIDGARKLSKTIHRGEEAIKAFAKRTWGGIPIIAGGDDLLMGVPASRFRQDQVDEMRELYAKTTGSTLSVGIGETMPNASKALIIAKNTGKDKAVVWSEDKAALYRKVITARWGNSEKTKARSQGVDIGESKADRLAAKHARFSRYGQAALDRGDSKAARIMYKYARAAHIKQVQAGKVSEPKNKSPLKSLFKKIGVRLSHRRLVRALSKKRK